MVKRNAHMHAMSPGDLAGLSRKHTSNAGHLPLKGRFACLGICYGMADDRTAWRVSIFPKNHRVCRRIFAISA
jgi:hypothetical protein